MCLLLGNGNSWGQILESIKKEGKCECGLVFGHESSWEPGTRNLYILIYKSPVLPIVFWMNYNYTTYNTCQSKTIVTFLPEQHVVFFAIYSLCCNCLSHSYATVNLYSNLEMPMNNQTQNPLDLCIARWAVTSSPWLFCLYRGWQTTQLYRDYNRPL